MHRHLLPLGALACGALLACLAGLHKGFLWSDFSWEALPAFTALAAAHLGRFLALAPLYAGSFALRAPAVALGVAIAGRSPTAIYYAGCAFCVAFAAAVAALCYLRSPAAGNRFAPVGLFLMAGGPLTPLALEAGHPEELLGAALLLAAVLCALRGRPLATGALLGLAIGSKEWAVVAVGPLLATVASRRGLAAAAKTFGGAVGGALLLLAPFLAASSRLVGSAAAVGTNAGRLLQPWSLWWFFGHPGPRGRQYAPHPLSLISHPLVVLLPLGASAYIYLRARRRGRPLADGQAFALLAFALLARGALDTWGLYYYYLPLTYLACAWELWVRPRSLPLYSLLASALALLICSYLPLHSTYSATAAAFALAACLACGLLWRLALGGRYSSSVSWAGSEVRIRLPSSPTTTSSSILTPSSPGR